MKNEIAHNHPAEPKLYENFCLSAVTTRCFGKNKNIIRQNTRKFQRGGNSEDEDEKWSFFNKENLIREISWF